MKKNIVVSAVNLTDGGTLTILRDFLEELSLRYSQEYNIFALVHDQSYFKTKSVIFIEKKEIKKSWIKRIIFEYFTSYKISKDINTYIWISMHDISSRVNAKKQFVYCHNPMCFYTPSFREFFFEPKLYLFSLFYKYLYRINIKSNTNVIVQQSWIKDNFEKYFDIDNILIAHPSHQSNPKHLDLEINNSEIINFFYPALSRFFKNFEVLLEAWASIQENQSFPKAFLTLTINGTENNYSKYIFKKYGHIKNVFFLGKIDSQEVHKIYQNTDCLIFPSKLETWGLPISEAKSYGIPVIASDLPYARENAGDYENINFFNHKDPEDLKEKIIHFIKTKKLLKNNNHNKYTSNSKTHESWESLLKEIIS